MGWGRRHSGARLRWASGPAEMFKVRFLPARFGDCIWLEYGTAGKTRNILVDGGTGGTRHHIRKLFETLPADLRRLELLVISHIDRDHVEGVLGFLEEAAPRLAISEVWFNGWPHLPDNPQEETFGAIQGERLTAQILRHGIPWNVSFRGRAVQIPDGGQLPQFDVSGLKLTVLSPTAAALERLKPAWEKEVRAQNLDPGFGLAPDDEAEAESEDEAFGPVVLPDVAALARSEFTDDTSAANESSITLVAEFDHKRVLLAADALARQMVASLERLSPARPYAVDLFKVSHHGSRNTTSSELVRKLRCSRYVFSTSGAIHHHPHAEAVSRVIVGGGVNPELIFNYRSADNETWDLTQLREQHGYSTVYPAEGEEGIEVNL